MIAAASSAGWVGAAWVGWVAAAVVTALWLVVQRSLDTRMEAVARACHELRGPITAARLGLELGLRGSTLSPAQLAAIQSELGRASLALDDLSCAREARSAPGELTSVDLRALLSDSVRAWQPVAARAGVDLRLQCAARLPAVWGDRLRLSQATGNLIANAIEHGALRVDVVVEQTEQGIRIEVADDGPGLPAPLADLVLRARRGRGAHGRGLAIATDVAAVHGGRLVAAPSARGARLVLELPR